MPLRFSLSTSTGAAPLQRSVTVLLRVQHHLSRSALRRLQLRASAPRSNRVEQFVARAVAARLRATTVVLRTLPLQRAQHPQIQQHVFSRSKRFFLFRFYLHIACLLFFIFSSLLSLLSVSFVRIVGSYLLLCAFVPLPFCTCIAKKKK